MRPSSVAPWLGLILLGCGARSDLGAERGPPPKKEVCNGLDDDGDGAVDEDIPELTCGVGACAASAPGCVAGQPGRCTPAPPMPEACNGRDDDCDGAIDEGLDFGLISGPHVVATDIFHPTGLEATSAGVVVAWTRVFNGSDPMPNSFLRLLDGDGAPLADAGLLQQDPVSLGVGPSLAPTTDGRLVAAMCRRFVADEYPTWRFVSPDGVPAGDEHAVAETTENCTTHDTPPQMLWTGERHLFSWITSTSDKVFLETSDAQGGSAAVELVFDGADLSAPPRLVQHEDRVAMVLGVRPAPQISELGVLFFDTAGRQLGEPIVMPDPGGSGYLQPRAAAAPDGSLLIIAKHRFGDGWIRARVDYDGSVLTEPELSAENLEFRDLEARAEGGFWGVAMADGDEAPLVLLRLDDTGDIAERFVIPEPGWWAHLAQRAGRVHVVYTAPAPEPRELHSVVYGCRP